LEVKVTLRNPLDKLDTLDYYIVPNDTQLAKDWIVALKGVLSNNLKLQKEFCFLGFPNSPRTLEYLCTKLNNSIETINKYDFTQHGLKDYIIEEWFHPDVVRFPNSYAVEQTRVWMTPEESRRESLGLRLKHGVMNQLHNHFEVLEGTVENPSRYGQVATPEVRECIGELNQICHEMESLILSQRKADVQLEWVRPSQIVVFPKCQRLTLTKEHRQGFIDNGYDREFGHVYMHWSQIGKTLFEVWRDEHAPDLTVGDDATSITVGSGATCEAITALKYFSGEFDVEWAKSVIDAPEDDWHQSGLLHYENWLLKHGIDPTDTKLSLGYLHLGKVDLERSFGTTDMFNIWNQLEMHLDIYSIEVDGVKNTFDYCWSDENELV